MNERPVPPNDPPERREQDLRPRRARSGRGLGPRRARSRPSPLGGAAILTLVALVTLGACSHQPLRRGPTGPLPTADDALAQLRANGARRRTIRAAGRATYYGEKGRVRVRMEVVAERADRFRVATISPFEQPIDVMTCDGTQLWLLSKGALKKGPATPRNVARLLPLPLEPSEIVDTLLGGIPTGDGYAAESIQATDAGLWRLSVLDQNGTERVLLTIDPGRTVVVAATIERPAGQPYLNAVFEDFLSVEGGGYYPERIHMTMPGRDVDVRLKFRRPEINVALDPALFRMAPPPGQTVRPL